MANILDIVNKLLDTHKAQSNGAKATTEGGALPRPVQHADKPDGYDEGENAWYGFASGPNKFKHRVRICLNTNTLHILNPAGASNGIKKSLAFDPFGFDGGLRKAADTISAGSDEPKIGQASASGERWITVHPNGKDEEGYPVKIKPNPDGSHSIIGGAGGSLNGLRMTNVKSPEEYKHLAKQHQEAKKLKAAAQKQEHFDTLHAQHRDALSKEALETGTQYTPEAFQAEAAKRAKTEYDRQGADQAQRAQQLDEIRHDKERDLVSLAAQAQGWTDYDLSDAALQSVKDNAIKQALATKPELQQRYLSSDPEQQARAAQQLQAYADKSVSKIKDIHHKKLLQLAKEWQRNLGQTILSAHEDISSDTLGDVHIGDLATDTLGDSGKGYVANLRAEALRRGMDLDAVAQEAGENSWNELVRRKDGDTHVATQAQAATAKMQEGAAAQRASVQALQDKLGEQGEHLEKLKTLSPVPASSDVGEAASQLAKAKNLEAQIRAAQQGAQAMQAPGADLDTLPPAAVMVQSKSLSDEEAKKAVQHDLDETARQQAVGALVDLYNAQDVVAPLRQHRLQGHSAYFANVGQVVGVRSPDPLMADVLGPDISAMVMRRALESSIGTDAAKIEGVKNALRAHHVQSQVGLCNKAVEEANELFNAADNLEVMPLDSMDSLLAGVTQNQQKLDLMREGRETVGLALGKMEAAASLNKAFMSSDKEAQVALGAIGMEDALSRAYSLGLDTPDKLDGNGNVATPGQFHIYNDGKNKILQLRESGMSALSSQLQESPEHLARAAHVNDIKAGKYDEDGWLPVGISRRPGIDVSGDQSVTLPDSQTDLHLGDLSSDQAETQAGDLVTDRDTQDGVYRQKVDHGTDSYPVGRSEKAPDGLYHYGLTHRPANESTVPEGYDKIAKHFHYDDYGTVAYKKPLTARQLFQFSLEPMSAQLAGAQTPQEAYKSGTPVSLMGGTARSPRIQGEISGHNPGSGFKVRVTDPNVPDNLKQYYPPGKDVDLSERQKGSMRFEAPTPSGADTQKSQLQSKLHDYIAQRMEAAQEPGQIARDMNSEEFKATHVPDALRDAYQSALDEIAPPLRSVTSPQDAIAHMDAQAAKFKALHAAYYEKQVKEGKLAPELASIHAQTVPQNDTTRDLVYQIALQDPRLQHAYAPIGSLDRKGKQAIRDYAYEHVFKDAEGKKLDPKDKEKAFGIKSPAELTAFTKWRELVKTHPDPYAAIQDDWKSKDAGQGGMLGPAEPHDFATVDLSDDNQVIAAAKAHAKDLGFAITTHEPYLNEQGVEKYRPVDPHYKPLTVTPERSVETVANNARNALKKALRDHAIEHMFGMGIKETPGNIHKEVSDTFNPENVITAGQRWARYCNDMAPGNRGEERALQTIQEKMQGDFATRFAKGHRQLTGTDLRTAPVPLSYANNHSIASLAPDAKADYLAQNQSDRAKAQNRTGAQFAEDQSVAEKAEAKKRATDQVALLSEQNTKTEKQKLDTHRMSLGASVEGMVRAMMPRIGLKQGTVAAGDIDMSSAKGVKRQRAIKMIEAGHRAQMSLSTGAGKTAVVLGAVSHLRSQGKVRRALLAVPAPVLEQFGSEAARFYDMQNPAVPRWHADSKATTEQRRAAYRGDSPHDMVVTTPQALRDDLSWALAEHKFDGDEDRADEFMRTAPSREREQAVQDAMNHQNWDFDFHGLDEMHDTLNRAGKVDSKMARYIDAATARSPYVVTLSADPAKNDSSEVFSWLQKVAPDRYVDDDDADARAPGHVSRAQFLRKYNINTMAAKEALQREMAPYHYAESMPPSVEKLMLPDPGLKLTPPQQKAYNSVTQNYQKARAARLRGEVDVEAIKALSPNSFANAPEDQHEAIAGQLVKSLGIVRDAAHDRVVNKHPQGAKLAELTRTIEAEPPSEHPRIIFSHDLESVDQIHDHLKKMGVRVAKITGTMSGAEKEKAKLKISPQWDDQKHDYVVKPEADVLVASDCAATGLNLQRCTRVSHYDIPHTDKTFQQRIGRAYRTGQQHDVHVQTMTTDTPYEQRRRKRLAKKAALREALTTPAELIDDSGLGRRVSEATDAARAGTVNKALQPVKLTPQGHGARLAKSVMETLAKAVPNVKDTYHYDDLAGHKRRAPGKALEPVAFALRPAKIDSMSTTVNSDSGGPLRLKTKAQIDALIADRSRAPLDNDVDAIESFDKANPYAQMPVVPNADFEDGRSYRRYINDQLSLMVTGQQPKVAWSQKASAPVPAKTESTKHNTHGPAESFIDDDDDIFYRVHWDDCPEFSPENAHSMTWAGRAEDQACPHCGGAGEIYGDSGSRECPECGGEGTVAEEPEKGYSCCDSAEELASYFSSRGEPDDNQRVVRFKGTPTGEGYDGETLVVPTPGTEQWSTWGEMKAQLNAASRAQSL